MGKFTVIPQNTFEELQLDAGVLLKTFDPETAAAPDDEDIICATTGGISVVCVPAYSDMGADIEAEELRVDHHVAAQNHPRLGQCVDALVDGRTRDPALAGNFEVGHARIFDQEAQDLPIDGVEICFHGCVLCSVTE